MLGEARMLRDFQAHERLHYIEAVAHETLRLKSVAPLLFFEPTSCPWISAVFTCRQALPVFLLTRHVGLARVTRFPPQVQFQPDTLAACTPATPQSGREPPSPGALWGWAAGVSRPRPGVARNQSGDGHALPQFY